MIHPPPQECFNTKISGPIPIPIPKTDTLYWVGILAKSIGFSILFGIEKYRKKVSVIVKLDTKIIKIMIYFYLICNYIETFIKYISF